VSNLPAAAPHLHEALTTRRIMASVVLSLLPAGAWGVLVLGPRALAVLAAAVGSSLAVELLISGLAWRRITVADGSALVTGMLVGCSLPAAAPLFIPAAAAAFAVAVVKMSFGGLGRNWMNPALGGRLFAALSWPALLAASARDLPGAWAGAPAGLPARWLPGWTFLWAGSSIAEVSIILLTASGIWLLALRIAAWEIPAAFAAAYASAVWVLGGLPGAEGWFRGDLPAALGSGGLALVALYMATDPVTSPATRRGRFLFGAGCGLFCFLFRARGSGREGSALAVLVMNMLVPLIERWRPRGSRA
jgi:electron transport complex protein RnfD